MSPAAGLALLAVAQASDRWPGLHIARSPGSPHAPSAPPPPPAPNGILRGGYRCGNAHNPLAMFVDSAAGCRQRAAEQRHNALGTVEYFAWSSFTLYCYGCSAAEVQSGSLVPDVHYDVYAVYAPPFYDPVAAFMQRAACYDTPGWHNPDFNTCETYAERRWCIDGVIEWVEHFGGAAFRYPERNCCVCGGGSSVAPAPSPPPSEHPMPCVDLKLQGTPRPHEHLVLLAVPGQAEPGVAVRPWADPANKGCADYAVKGARTFALDEATRNNACPCRVSQPAR